MEIFTTIGYYLGVTTRILFELFSLYLVISFFICNLFVARLLATKGVFETVKLLKNLK